MDLCQVLNMGLHLLGTLAASESPETTVSVRRAVAQMYPWALKPCPKTNRCRR